MRPWHKVLSCLLMLGALVVTLARTVRLPNDWAEAHWLLDYRFGFVKRGLPGQLLTWMTNALGVTIDEGILGGVALAIFAAFGVLLFLMACRVARSAAWSPAVVALMVAFLTSPFLVMTGHLVGYYDHLFLCMGVLSMWLALRGKFWSGAVVQVVALLVHESCVALIYPAFALACLLRAARTEPGERPPSLLPLLLPLAMAVVMAIVLASPPAAFVAHFGNRLKQFPFIGGGYDTITPGLLVLSPGEAWALVSPKYAERMAQPSSFGLVLPTMIALLVGFAQRTRLPHLSVEAAAVAVVVLLPQALHLIAWDLERIWTYSIFTTFLVVWLYVEARRSEGTEGVGVFVASLLAVGANLIMETPLLDNAQDRLPCGMRGGVLLALLGGLLLLGCASSSTTWRERFRLQGRSLTDFLFRRRG